MVSKGLLTFLLCSAIAFPVVSQDGKYDMLLASYLKSDSLFLDQLENDMTGNSLDILDLIDSLVNTDFRYSLLSIRTGYTSKITYADRNLGFQQQGLSTGVSYYHKTGLFADISSYWNSDLASDYSPAIISVGYFGDFTNKWTYSLSYDHYMYPYTKDKDELAYNPITNSLDASMYFDIGKFTLSGDYSLLFSNESMHRIHGNLMYSLTGKDLGFIDRIVFMPTASVQLGNTQIAQPTPAFPFGSMEFRYKIRQLLFAEYGEQFIRYIFRYNREKYHELEYQVTQENQGLLSEYSITTDKAFGIMNYSLSAPVYLYINNFTFSLSYHYNIPVALPGEELILEPNSYIGATILYNIPFMGKK